MIGKPIAQISKFTGMSDDGGMYYMDGFSIEKEQGLTSIDENYLSSELVSTATTGYTNLSSVSAIQYVYPLVASNIGNQYTVMLNENANLYAYDTFNDLYHGKIGGTASTGDFLFCQKPDIFQLQSGNLIYTSSRHLSLVVRGLCKSSSTTGKIVSKSGQNFTALGLSSASINNKVTNLITGAEYTITSISTTDSTNDTLNFTASGTLANAENDEFMAIVLTKWDLNYVNGISGTAVTIPTFQGQQGQVYWSRPIRQYNIGDVAKFMILSGNYIALLSNDESTMDATYKQLPTNYQGVSFDVNGSQILVSAYDINGNSHLLLWDGYSDGWIEDKIISTAPFSIEAYGSGFIYLSDGVLYYTDGVNIKKLIGFPDSVNLGGQANCVSHNSIATINDKVYIAVRNNNLNRGYDGVLVFDLKSGLTQFKCKRNGVGFASPKCIYVKTNTATSNIYSTSNDIEIGCDGSLNNLNEFQSSSLFKDCKAFVYLLDFKQETNVGQVWLNLKRNSKKYFTDRVRKNTIITVNYGNDNQPLIKYGSTGANTTTTATNPNGVAYPATIGDEVEFITGSCAGERTFITGVTDGGTASEAWTLSPALSTTYNSSSQLKMWSMKKGETKTITLDDLNKPVIFNTNFLGSKMYLEIVINGVTNSFAVSIQDILIF